MNVYFGKMENKTECDNFRCSCSKGDGYFGGIQPGDYAFIRLAEDGAKESRLWKLNRIDTDAYNNSTAYFEDVFSFNPITTERLVRLKLFNIDKNLVIFTFRQAKNVGFYKLELTDDASFNAAITSFATFNSYTSDSNNLREIIFVDDASTTHSDKDVQIIKNPANEYIIYNSDKSFIAGLQSEYQSDRYQKFCDYLANNPSVVSNKSKCNSQKKVKEWLECNGTGKKITLLNLWDLFCSKVSFKDVNDADEDADSETVDTENPSNETSASKSAVKDDYKNLIVYGIPGCGKSHLLKEKYLTDKEVYRTTFHPDYTNTDFIGQIRPVKKGKDLDYVVVPGPFSRALLTAIASPDKKIALVIEEINRGNAAAIFGDLFQLLDRDSSGESEYQIKNEVISNYLSCNGHGKTEIKIPANLYIYATMNTSDQNVFKLDTAFKRRWEFKRVTNKDTQSAVKDFYVCKINGNNVSWEMFVGAINRIITNNDEISGDRQIGNFFYIGNDLDLERFANKVLEYLYNDVCKYGGKEEIFNTGKYHSFDEIYDAFVNGDNVFIDNLFNFTKSIDTQVDSSTDMTQNNETAGGGETTENPAGESDEK